MDDRFFERPILNSPYAYPGQHWELDAAGLPTGKLVEARRRAEFITPIRKPKKRKQQAGQQALPDVDLTGVGTVTQKYDPTPIINELRGRVDAWRSLPNPTSGASRQLGVGQEP
jgi:type III restriction enzyme